MKTAAWISISLPLSLSLSLSLSLARSLALPADIFKVIVDSEPIFVLQTIGEKRLPIPL
jgi:hypothetical protein